MAKLKRVKRKLFKIDPKNKSLKDFLKEKPKSVKDIEDLAFKQLLILTRRK